MTCDEAERLLLDEAGGHLESGRREGLREHLATCSTCRRAAGVQAEVSQVLAARPESPVRPGFGARVSQAIAGQSGWLGLADWRWLSVRLAPVAALLLLAAGIVVERQASQAAAPASLSAVVDTWAADDSAGGTPVTSVLWQPQASEDRALLTLLAAPSDATIVSQTNER